MSTKYPRPAAHAPDEYPGRNARRALFAQIRRSVVGIVHAPDMAPSAHPSQAAESLHRLDIIGTGFLVDATGIVLTARHVIEPWIRADQARVKNGGVGPQLPTLKILVAAPVKKEGNTTAWEFMVTGVGPFRYGLNVDFAALAVRVPPHNHSFGPLSALGLSQEPCQEGDEVVMCGFPFGRALHRDQLGGMAMTASFTQGIVSATLPFPGAPTETRTMFQMDASINNGMSGGPVVDVVTGKVVGLTVGTVLMQRAAEPPSEAAATHPAPAADIPTGLARAVDVHAAFEAIRTLREDLKKLSDLSAQVIPYPRPVPPDKPKA
jgi:S1-C subfamily serine protease